MGTTTEEKKEQARQIAQWAFRKWKTEGNRFYVYKKHYYLRTGDETGWLIDFEKRDDIIEEVWNGGGLKHPSTSHKNVMVDELLQLVKHVAVPINTAGVQERDFADPLLSEIERLESFVNACDERNPLQMKG
jgi:hypothetical protein